MLDLAQLLLKYKEEKGIVCGGDPLEEARFLSFKQWKVEYVQQYVETHRTVSVDIADKMMEDAQHEADVELAAMAANPQEKQLMTDETTPVAETATDPVVTEAVEVANETETTVTETDTDKTETPAPPAPKTKAKAAKKATTKKAAAKPAKKAAAKNQPVTKTSKAQKIFDQHFGSKARNEIIKMFMTDVGLTSNGAATYYQKMKKAAETKA